MNSILFHFPNGEELIHVQREAAIVLRFHSPRAVLSTSLQNGGYRDDLQGIFNVNCGRPDNKNCMSLSEFSRFLDKKAEALGLSSGKATGIGTAADMENAAVVTETYRELSVTACVTAGIKGNAGCAGDPAFYYEPDLEAAERPGTINILLFLGAAMPPGILTRALVTCTEAKTAALRELLAGSRYSMEPATGTGTDSTIITADSSAPVFFHSAGKHSKLGELIGRVVKAAVKEALRKQNGLDAKAVRHISQIGYRYGMTEEALRRRYVEQTGKPLPANFHSRWLAVDQNPEAVTASALFLHFIDMCRWGLAENADIVNTARLLASHMGVKADLRGGSKEDLINFWQNILLKKLVH